MVLEEVTDSLNWDHEKMLQPTPEGAGCIEGQSENLTTSSSRTSSQTSSFRLLSS
jgi:hypothetical protein